MTRSRRAVCRPSGGVAAIVVALVGCEGGSADGGRDATGLPPMTTTATSTGSGEPDSGPGPSDSTSSPGTSAVTTTGPGGDTETSGDTSETTGVPLTCGDMMVQPPEACDDGNMTDADGCNNDCTISGSILFEHTQQGGADLTEQAFGVAVDDEGNAYVVGELTQADSDVWLRQYTPDDGLGFTVALNLGAADGARAVAAHGTDVFVAGYAGANAYVVKYDNEGNQGWSDTYNGPANGADVAHGIAVDSAGNAVAAGQHTVNYFNGVSNIPHNNGYVRKYDAGGAVQWTVQFVGGSNTSDDRAFAVAVDSADNVIAAGFLSGAGGGRDLWVRKLDPAGAELWTQTFAGAEGLDDEARAVAVGPDDSIVVAGFESSVGIPTSVWMRKYDPDGIEQWTETWPGAAAEGAAALGVAVDDVGDIVVTGWATNMGVDEMFVRKYADNGAMKWSTPITGFTSTDAIGWGVTIAPNQRVWAAGGIDLGIDGRDIYVARLAQ